MLTSRGQFSEESDAEQRATPLGREIMLGDLNSVKWFLSAYVPRFQGALQFAAERLKSGKGWDEECDEVIGPLLPNKG
jgi:hypothetical protein